MLCLLNNEGKCAEKYIVVKLLFQTGEIVYVGLSKEN